MTIKLNRNCEVCGVNINHKRTNAKFCCRAHKGIASGKRRDYAEEYQNNIEVRRARALKSYYADHEKSKKLQLERQKQNLDKAAAYQATRRALKMQRTPSWLTEIDKERIQNEYKLAALQSKLTGEPWHVDHVIPLQGKFVSGLHVPSNLKAIRGKDNISKHNKFEIL